MKTLFYIAPVFMLVLEVLTGELGAAIALNNGEFKTLTALISQDRDVLVMNSGLDNSTSVVAVSHVAVCNTNPSNGVAFILVFEAPKERDLKEIEKISDNDAKKIQFKIFFFPVVGITKGNNRFHNASVGGQQYFGDFKTAAEGLSEAEIYATKWEKLSFSEFPAVATEKNE